MVGRWHVGFVGLGEGGGAEQPTDIPTAGGSLGLA